MSSERAMKLAHDWLYEQAQKMCFSNDFRPSHTDLLAALLDQFAAEARAEAQEEVAKFVDVCAEQCAVKARSICEPNFWWPKNQVLVGVAEQIRERAKATLTAQAQKGTHHE